jgi:CheY-like chemotaxis protein
MVAEYLQFRGFTVRQAASGSEALKIARHELPKIILMDLSIPEVDGWEATRRLKADPNTREAIVIAVTAHALSPDEQKARDAGCDGFIAKPFDLSDVADGLERVMVLGRQGLAFLPKTSHAPTKGRKDAGT